MNDTLYFDLLAPKENGCEIVNSLEYRLLSVTNIDFEN